MIETLNKKESEALTSSESSGCRGHIVEIDEQQNVWIDFEDNTQGKPLYALLGKPFSIQDLQKVLKNKWQVYLEFESNNPQKPIIQHIYYPILDDILNRCAETDEENKNLIHVKGKVIILDADEIILNANQRIHIRSGKSRLFLNAFGDFVQKARQIVSRSTKTTKLKGGVVEIN